MKGEGLATMAKAKRRVQIHSIQADYGGTTYHGTYTVERGILTVRSGLGSRSTQLETAGTVNPAGRAKQILLELAKQEPS